MIISYKFNVTNIHLTTKYPQPVSNVADGGVFDCPWYSILNLKKRVFSLHFQTLSRLQRAKSKKHVQDVSHRKQPIGFSLQNSSVDIN